MIAIIDSGSTRSKWCFYNPENDQFSKVELRGINPTSDIQSLSILDEIDPYIFAKLEKVYWYGAGINTIVTKEVIKKGFVERCLKLESITVENDLLAACRATAFKDEAYVSILGTGSNACYYNGNNVEDKVASLGYLFDDEGSAYEIGKQIILSYVNDKMGTRDFTAFESYLTVPKEELLISIYGANKIKENLASYAKFLPLASDQYKENLLTKIFSKFIEKKINPIRKNKIEIIHFIGSIAYYYSDILKSVCNANNLKIGKVLQDPMSGLIKYHLNK